MTLAIRSIQLEDMLSVIDAPKPHNSRVWYIKTYGHSAGLPLFLTDAEVTYVKDLFFFNLQYAHLYLSVKGQNRQ